MWEYNNIMEQNKARKKNRKGRVGIQRAVREGFRKRDALSRALKGVQGKSLGCPWEGHSSVQWRV